MKSPETTVSYWKSPPGHRRIQASRWEAWKGCAISVQEGLKVGKRGHRPPPQLQPVHRNIYSCCCLLCFLVQVEFFISSVWQRPVVCKLGYTFESPGELCKSQCWSLISVKSESQGRGCRNQHFLKPHRWFHPAAKWEPLLEAEDLISSQMAAAFLARKCEKA